MFTATYDQALCNAIRQTLVDGTSDTAPAYTMVGDSEYSAVKNLLGRMEGVVRYEHHVPENFTNSSIEYFNCSNYRGTCNETHYIRADSLEQVVLLELNRMVSYLKNHAEEFAELLA